MNIPPDILTRNAGWAEWTNGSRHQRIDEVEGGKLSIEDSMRLQNDRVDPGGAGCSPKAAFERRLKDESGTPLTGDGTQQWMRARTCSS
jgi:hypothetical protein